MNIADWLRHESQFWPHLGPKLVEAADEIERLRAGLREIAKQYGNQDLNHVDFRVAAKRAADAALSPHQGGGAAE